MRDKYLHAKWNSWGILSTYISIQIDGHHTDKQKDEKQSCINLCVQSRWWIVVSACLAGSVIFYDGVFFLFTPSRPWDNHVFAIRVIYKCRSAHALHQCDWNKFHIHLSMVAFLFYAPVNELLVFIVWSGHPLSDSGVTALGISLGQLLAEMNVAKRLLILVDEAPNLVLSEKWEFANSSSVGSWYRFDLFEVWSWSATSVESRRYVIRHSYSCENMCCDNGTADVSDRG